MESAVGAYLLKRSFKEHFDVCWWREGTKEVDFVIQDGTARTAIEVKSGKIKGLGGLDAFTKLYPNTHTFVVGSSEVPLDAFLLGEIPLSNPLTARLSDKHVPVKPPAPWYDL